MIGHTSIMRFRKQSNSKRKPYKKRVHCTLKSIYYNTSNISSLSIFKLFASPSNISSIDHGFLFYFFLGRLFQFSYRYQNIIHINTTDH